ncbi:integrase catalytic domain-containing protein [Trichonephila clavata]|uniref:Integrase catalytic domain-containing protein n=1 Tax=Trichonephila clavata TaxID=2740835 RepID=A0A8X6KIB6_TRICU|nr:integrase catalytic domain-containing protein [Trichonephila clavata]
MISNKKQPEKSAECELLVSDTITNAVLPTPNLTIERLIETNHMAQSDLCLSQSNKEIHVLIGADLYWQFHTGCIKRINNNLFCVETVFGWTLTGNNNFRKNMDSIVENLCFCEHQSNCNSESYSLEDINSQMRKIWEIDNLGMQITAPLPRDRIEQSPPFDVTGLDFAGPIFVKNSKEKFYILLCTCAVTRSLHLELVTSLTTEAFLLAFRRFISRRGLCTVIYSDNARTFKRAEIELRRLWTIINHPDVKEFCASKCVKWKYIIERGAWWGGFYERIVRSVKTILRKVIGKSSLTSEELETVLCEIEAVLNSRPITYIDSDSTGNFPLTPSHFLLGRRLTSLLAVKLSSIDCVVDKKVLIKRFNYRERLLNNFWRQWRKDYLLNLKSVHFVNPTRETEFKIDDIVLIHDDRLPRSLWKLGKVVEIFIDRDKRIRACALKTENSIIKRPVQLLHNLEIPN